MVVDECAQLIYANAAAEQILGLWSDEVVGRSLLRFVHPEDVGTFAEALISSIDSGRNIDAPLAVRMRHAGHAATEQWSQVEVLSKNLLANPAVGGILINARNVSPRDKADLVNDVARQSFKQVFQRSPIGMALTTLEGAYTRVNDAMCELLATSEEQLLNASVLDTTHPDDLRATVDAAVELLEGRTVSFSLEKRFLAAGDRPVWTRATTTLLRDAHDNPVQFLTQVEDIEERHQLIEQLRISALRDPLTGLANRAGLTDYLASMPDDSVIGVMAVDLDRFKTVNDSEGHAVGDSVLCAVSQRISSSIRSDDQAARTGGDEFVVIFSDPRSIEEFTVMAHRFVREVQAPIAVNDLVITIGASAGLAVGPVSDATALMVRADRASYEAKRSGAGVVAAELPL